MTYGLNLLPPQLKRTVAFEDLFSNWRTGLIMLVTVSIALCGALWAASYSLRQRETEIEAQVAQQRLLSNRKGTTDITIATTKVNDTITLLSGAIPVTRHWDVVIQSILGELPTNITIASLEILPSGRVTLKGTAATRSDFIKLQETLTESKVLQQATTSDTASKRENLPFTYLANLKPQP